MQNSTTTVIKSISDALSISIEESELIYDKAVAGGEIEAVGSEEDWLTKRFLPNCVIIDEAGYTKMCIDALKILSTTAATDYGSSRQRDLGQLWADMTRGYIGELAFIIFLKRKWKINGLLAHQKGKLEDFLSRDLHLIRDPMGEDRKPRINISFKTTKWNGIWLDIPGDQFDHSDVHILIKVGTGRDHLFAFFKKISVFKDKILKKGEEVGSLTSSESESLFDNLPNFTPIPSYICGYVLRDNEYSDLSYKGHKGIKHYTITGWNGPVNKGDIEIIKSKERIAGKVEFLGIRKFAHEKGYLFNTGCLKWSEDDWNKIIDKI